MKAFLPLFLLLSMLFPPQALSSPPLYIDPLLATPSLGEIKEKLSHLKTVGSLLYVAAHPDDENTRLLAWASGKLGLYAHYVALNRGSGGQNLIGQELSSLLGVIRTEELLAARRLDGAKQYFTRAIDFGYSKSAKESLAFWNQDQKDAVLEDLVRVIRESRPDLMVTRFSIHPPNHGHHTASALLAREAFTLAADKKAFPSQIQEGENPHQILRFFENMRPWSFEKDQDFDAYYHLDVGSYSPNLGKSYAEIAAESRSMHKSQGFGATADIGRLDEYFELVAEAHSKPKGKNPLEGLDFTWSRFDGCEGISKALAKVEASFDLENASPLLKALVKAKREMEKRLQKEDPKSLLAYYLKRKMADIDALLIDVTGLFFELRSEETAVTHGQETELQLRVWRRNEGSVQLKEISLKDAFREQLQEELGKSPYEKKLSLTIPKDLPYSTPYWLRDPSLSYLYTSAQSPLIYPKLRDALSFKLSLNIEGEALEVLLPPQYIYTDRIHGKRLRPLELSPPIALNPHTQSLLLPNGKAQELSLTVLAFGGPQSGHVTLEVPKGWTTSPSLSFSLEKGAQQDFRFTVTPPKDAFASATLRFSATVNGKTYTQGKTLIQHPHIPTQSVLQPALVRAESFPFQSKAQKIAYITGPGDLVRESLQSIGLSIDALSINELSESNLSEYDAIIAGVRLYNSHPEMKHTEKQLLDYVKNGGHYIIQYQVSSSFFPLNIPMGPLPFEISSGRVTNEKAPVTLLDKALAEGPNPLTNKDFQNWVQERGLYFASTWDPAYSSPLSMADPDEEAQAGSLLAIPYGDGVFIYTGLSFFRQLPAGVPGAFRLFANLLSYRPKVHHDFGTRQSP